MKGKFGAAELQFLTKAIDTAIAVGGKVIGAVERSQIDKGATSDAVAAAARSEGGMGGQRAMDAVSRAQAAAELGAGTLGPGPATYAMEQEASLASAPVATEEVVAVQEVGRPIVAVGDAPERAAYPEGHPTRWPSEITRSGGRPIGPGHPLRWPSEPYRRGGQTLQGPASRQMGPLADALGRAQALEAQAKESGNPDYLSEAWSVYDDISSGRHGALTDEQRSALIASPLINSAPFRAAFVGELPEVGGATAPTAAVPMAQPTARAAPQPRTMMSAEEALFRQRRQLDERERQRAAAFLPQNLRRMRPGQLQAILRFARTPQEAAAVMGAIRRAPEVQPQGLSDVLSGGHVSRAQAEATKGWRPPRAQAPVSEFERAIALERHNAWLRESQARAAANQALTDKRNAAIKAAQDKIDRDALRRSSRVSGSSGGDRTVFGNLMAHRKYYQAYQEGTGRFSAPSVADRLSRAHGESMQYSEADISAARDADWRGLTGGLSDATPADREDRARGLFSSRRGGKKYSSIVKDIKASDKKVIDQALKTEKEARIAQNQAARIEQARQRLRMRLESAAKNLSAAQRDLAKANAARRVGTRDQEAYYDAWAQELVKMMGQGAAPEQAPPPSTPVAPVPAGDDALIEQMKAKYGQAE